MRADTPVHIKDSYILSAGKDTAYLLVVGVFEGAGRGTKVESKESSIGISHWPISVFPLIILNHIGTPKIPSRADVEIHPDNFPRLHIFLGVGLDDLLDDGFSHGLIF